MSKDLVLQLRYLGFMPQTGFVEYGFSVKNKDNSTRQIVLTIADDFFLKNELKLQEAPDLCYQKVLTDLAAENSEECFSSGTSVTALDIANYRNMHPLAKLRKSARNNVE
jgi:hypothetical protein